MGGQKTLRSYWRNYFEKTDALIWVVDATDKLRIEDCKTELHGLLQEEVPHLKPSMCAVAEAKGVDADTSENRDYPEPLSWCLPTRQMWKGA